jgi:hypothetical protein
MLPLIPNDTGGRALAVNDSGEITGYSSGPHGTRAVRWMPSGKPQDLGALLGADFSQGLAIGAHGEVIGASGNVYLTHAFIWTHQAGMRDLNDSLPPGSPMVLASAVSINRKGQILCFGDVHDRAADSNHSQHQHIVATIPFLLTPVAH